MAYLFDCAQRTEFHREPHASRLRIQRHRHWNAWRCVFSDPEFFSSAEVLAYLRGQAEALERRIMRSTDEFFEFCVLATDLVEDETTVDTDRFVDLMIKAHGALGDAPFTRVAPGLGPQRALEAVLEKEGDLQRRQMAFDKFVDETSIWTSYRLVALAVRDAFGWEQRPPKPLDSRLIGDESRIEKAAGRWIEKAARALETFVTPNGDNSAYHLCVRIGQLRRDKGFAATKMSEIIESRPDALNLLFSDDEHRDERIKCDDDVPEETRQLDARQALAALERSPGFENSRRTLVEYWRRIAEKSAESNATPAQETSNAA